MKKIFLIILTNCIYYSINAQQIIQLKSGEKINGKLEKVFGDSIVFNFKGSKIKLASSEIGAIFFDEKLLQEAKPNISSEIKGGKISGVATYFFNDNYGDKPDVGAVIYFLDSVTAATFQHKNSTEVGIKTQVVFNYVMGSAYRDMVATYKSIHEKVPDDVLKGVTTYGVETDEKYKQMGDDAMQNFVLIDFASEKVTADGNGSYSKNLKPGTYYVIIQSKHRERLNNVEAMGDIDFKIIRLKSGDEINFSYNFPVR